MIFATRLAQAGQREQALQETNTGLTPGGDDAALLYNLCCVYCIASDYASGIEAFRRAIAAGYSNFQWIRRDHDLEQIRSDPEFVALMAAK